MDSVALAPRTAQHDGENNFSSGNAGVLRACSATSFAATNGNPEKASLTRSIFKISRA
jgi:hypothetical protein